MTLSGENWAYLERPLPISAQSTGNCSTDNDGGSPDTIHAPLKVLLPEREKTTREDGYPFVETPPPPTVESKKSVFIAGCENHRHGKPSNRFWGTATTTTTNHSSYSKRTTRVHTKPLATSGRRHSGKPRSPRTCQ